MCAQTEMRLSILSPNLIWLEYISFVNNNNSFCLFSILLQEICFILLCKVLLNWVGYETHEMPLCPVSAYFIVQIHFSKIIIMLSELVFHWISQLDAVYEHHHFNIAPKTMKANIFLPPGINFNNGALRQHMAP